MKDRNPNSPYGVVCADDCGPQGLTKQEYNRQMDKPSSLWVCPVCRGTASWDDDRYEKAEETPELNLPNEPLYSFPMEKDEMELVMLATSVLRGAVNGDITSQIESFGFYAQLEAEHPGILEEVCQKLVKLAEAHLESIK